MERKLQMILILLNIKEHVAFSYNCKLGCINVKFC